MKAGNIKWWVMWLMLSVGLGAYNAYALLGEDKTLYIPGETSHGHYQIEMACEACHGEAFEGEEAIQSACVKCHGEELKTVDDSHPKSKFTDPRNADRIEILDARVCVTCHVEHKPEKTRAMGVTLADDFCFYCHQDIEEDRPSHKGMAFDTCASAGCHNYHDNQALYEDFLLKHTAEPTVLPDAQLPLRNFRQWLAAVERQQSKQLGMADADAPIGKKLDSVEAMRWANSGHAQTGVNCSSCHVDKKLQSGWIDKPGFQVCQTCHDKESDTFQAGKHGMRLAQSQSPMKPALARQPMKDDQHNAELGCSTCHGGHGFNLKQAAAESCIECHDDQHTRAYKTSSHYELWQKEIAGELNEGQGVSCASCHMPRQVIKQKGHQRVLVQHNQNLNLRPNEKMLRDVCMQCHGYEFAVNALADETLIKNNFSGSPTIVIDSVEMAIKREREKKAKSG